MNHSKALSMADISAALFEALCYLVKKNIYLKNIYHCNVLYL